MQVYGVFLGVIVGILYNLLGYFKHTDGRAYDARLLIRAILIGAGAGIVASFKGWDIQSPEAWAWAGTEIGAITWFADWLIKIIFGQRPKK